MIVTSKEVFGKQIGRFIKALKAQDITWKEFEWLGDFDVEIEFSNEVVAQIFVNEKDKNLTFDIGVIVQSGGSYWVPPDCDFKALLSTESLFDALVEVLVIPERWKAHYKIESYFMPEEAPDETIYDN